ncbi:HigA family addiction module antitoxin [Pseudomonas serbica]|jgi:addiction module HigA family antidote|uniref:HigA family addiction module antitoxin n=1 Tax=Pseudomonas serbica TaxID=2965074 RepID=UPI00237B1E14|nr:HigA family addiction module antitoxin [Pseudomonas serbica]
MNCSHPGSLLIRRYMGPLGIKAQDLAAAMGISKSQLSRVLAGKCGITADVALRLEYVLGSEAKTWMSLQAEFDLAKASEGFDTSKLTQWPIRYVLVQDDDIQKGCQDKPEKDHE